MQRKGTCLRDGAKRGDDGHDHSSDKLEKQDEPVQAQDLAIGKLWVVGWDCPSVGACRHSMAVNSIRLTSTSVSRHLQENLGCRTSQTCTSADLCMCDERE